MVKASLKNFIQKYHLGGAADSVKWKIKNNVLSTRFIAEDKSVLGFVSMENVDLPNSEFGIYGTANLSRVINMLGSMIDISIKNAGQDDPIALEFKDDGFNVSFALSELSVIPKAPDADDVPSDWVAYFKLNDDFAEKFVKAVNAIGSKNFAITYDKAHGIARVVVGYSTVNTTHVSIDVESEYTGNPLPTKLFSAKHLKEILNANKEADEMTLSVSSEGVANISFDILDYKSDYYLIEVDEDE